MSISRPFCMIALGLLAAFGLLSRSEGTGRGASLGERGTELGGKAWGAVAKRGRESGEGMLGGTGE